MPAFLSKHHRPASLGSAIAAKVLAVAKEALWVLPLFKKHLLPLLYVLRSHFHRLTRQRFGSCESVPSPRVGTLHHPPTSCNRPWHTVGAQ